MSRAASMSEVETVPFTVADFIEAGRESLGLELVAGADHLGKIVEEPIVNRPGLALTGFFTGFEWRRMQLVGNAEWSYLASLPAEERIKRFSDLIAHRAEFFVFTGKHAPSPEFIKVAEKSGAIILASSIKTRVFARLATFLMERLCAPRTTIYGTMIEVFGLGILIEGDAGLGKSETALGLVKRGCALIADDLTCIRKDTSSNLVYGSASDATRGYMEIRGIGIIHLPSVFGINAVRGEKRLQLVVTFKRFKDLKGDIDRIGHDRKTRNILGVNVPNVVIPVSEGRDLVNLVEMAAQQEKLLTAGYDVVGNLSDRLKKRADEKREIKKKGQK
jgi:HPr kinase/phosphorylase